MTMLDEVRFWLQVIDDSRRTVLCSPELESRVKTMVDAHGVGGLVTVRADRFIPEGRVYIVDENKIKVDVTQPAPGEIRFEGGDHS